jgi:hypothetical protein|nr:MAG TPA: hypothetical protein [Caudoviricetes sp.]
MDKKKIFSLNGPTDHIARDRFIRELPFNFNPINNIAFIDAPTDYILLAKLTQKTNEIIAVINALNAAMDNFYERVDAAIQDYVIQKIEELLKSGAIKLQLTFDEGTGDINFSLITDADTLAEAFARGRSDE